MTLFAQNARVATGRRAGAEQNGNPPPPLHSAKGKLPAASDPFALARCTVSNALTRFGASTDPTCFSQLPCHCIPHDLCPIASGCDTMCGTMGFEGTTSVDAASAEAIHTQGDWGNMNKDMLQQVGMLLTGQDIAAARLVCATWRKGISWGVHYLRPRTVPNAGAAL